MSESTDRQFTRAATLLQLRRFPEAAEAASTGLRESPENPHGLCLLAQAQLGMRDNDAALASAQRALASDPESSEGFRIASIAHIRSGRRSAALESARDAVRAGPHSALAFGWLATVLASDPRTTDWSEARAAAAQAITLSPHSPWAYYAAGQVEAAARNNDGARAAFEKVLELDPQNSAAHNELARLDLRGARGVGSTGLASAASGFATAVRADPRSTAGRHNLDLVVGVFVVRASYFLSIAAWVAFVVSSSGSLIARLIPVIALGVTAVFVVRFVRHLDRQLRGYLWRSLLHPTSRAIAVALDAVAVLALVATVPVSEHLRGPLALCTFLCALAARIVILVQHRRSVQKAQRQHAWEE